MDSKQISMALWILQVLRVCLFCFYSFFFWMPFVLSALLTMRSYSDSIFYRWARVWGQHSLKILGIQLDLEHPEISDSIQCSVLISNHQSTLDFLIWAALLPPRTIGIGKSEIAYIPYCNLIWWAARFIFLHRDDHDRATDELSDVAKRMNHDTVSVVIMPEGRRTPDGQIHEFKYGAFMLALEVQRPIRPFVISGAFRLLPRYNLIPLPGTIYVRALKEISTRNWSKDALDQHIEALYQSMFQVQMELESLHNS